MKPIVRRADWIGGGWVVCFATCFLCRIEAERLCPPLYVGGPPTPCPMTIEFERPVDLDGDAPADFIHARFTAWNHQDFYGAANVWVGYIHQDDTIEAFFPEPHVEMYRRIWGPTFGDPELPVAAGEELLPEPLVLAGARYGSWGLPEPARGYVYPRFEAEGIGIIRRETSEVPCRTTPPEPGPCYGGGGAGYMWGPADPWWTMPKSDRYFGFRVLRADGWHLGWLHLKWEARADGPDPAPLTFAGSAVHPEPDTAMVVGEPARPTLRVVREGSELVVSWSAVWEGALLQQKRALGDGTWEPVPGVNGNTVRLPVSAGQGYFRLVTP